MATLPLHAQRYPLWITDSINLERAKFLSQNAPETWLARRTGWFPPKPVVLPESASKVEWQHLVWLSGQVAGRLRPRTRVLADVTFKNAGDHAWPDAAEVDPSRSGAYAVRLSYRWRNASRTGSYDARSDLRETLAPGQATTFGVPVVTPDAPGYYELQLDLVQEMVAWFEARGAKRFVLPVHVGWP